MCQEETRQSLTMRFNMVVAPGVSAAEVARNDGHSQLTPPRLPRMANGFKRQGYEQEKVRALSSSAFAGCLGGASRSNSSVSVTHRFL